MGSIPIFIVPIGFENQTRLYEAVFN
jgi:hypothetical protein